MGVGGHACGCVGPLTDGSAPATRQARVRRFFDGCAMSDGVIENWLPAEGGEAALWHMVHDDGDEEGHHARNRTMDGIA